MTLLNYTTGSGVSDGLSKKVLIHM